MKRKSSSTLFGLCTALILLGCSEISPLGPDGPGPGGPGAPIPLVGLNTIGLVIEAPSRGENHFLVQLGVAAGDGTESTWAAGISQPRFEVGDQSWSLLTTSRPGVFETDSRRSPGLRVEPGQRVRFSFDVTDATGRTESFEAYVDAPETRNEPELMPSTAYLAGEPIEITWREMEAAALLVHRLDQSPQTTFSTFSLLTPGDIPTALQTAVQLAQARRIVVPPSALPTPATYRAELLTFAVRTTQPAGWLSTNHGAQSWYGIALSRGVEFDAF